MLDESLLKIVVTETTIKRISNRGDAGESCHCVQNFFFFKIFEFFNNVVLFDVAEAF